MHIPDGLMDPVVWLAGFVVTLPILALAFRRLAKGTREEQIPLMAVLAAGIFAAQMLNFPIVGGTTGHFLGAAFVSILLGLLPTTLVMTVVVVVQCLFFGDGGITALGLNLVNMAFVAPVVSWAVCRPPQRGASRPAMFTAAWLSVFVSALLVALELSISFWLSNGVYGVTPLVSFPAMIGYYSVIGIGEGIITVGIWTFVSRVAPELARAGEASMEAEHEA